MLKVLELCFTIFQLCVSNLPNDISSVIVLSMLMIQLSNVIVIQLQICGDNELESDPH